MTTLEQFYDKEKSNKFGNLCIDVNQLYITTPLPLPVLHRKNIYL